ncbi:TetR family transcriptional regulator [Oerskovia turbata]|uniref:TetR family transcriptional regulator n=1 Tax=Oerskovia turbata TaxID=1713 RepID=A0A4Q1L124_9CELL|nr:TetR/AcrR family transcriptional regulator [Oerskovia turbata]RXR27075.1 TetR family transcriptional regulator [Oerskovia turbata]RXR36357.1 TetR family transcriptional regulator [Oerskovia turbata]TGJ95478.1 TetR family transcriptional regulator [Actinotalea fermentans ATCC 43279 = JCM 9966 = DSM 3133]
MRSASRIDEPVPTRTGPRAPDETEAPDAPDLTARARIRDAALLRFASEGFRVPVRTIAADAGVSPGLVIHHFGSKEGLRRACDEHVLVVIRENKRNVLGDEHGSRSGPVDVLTQLASIEEFGPVLGYVLRSLQEGGDLARSFVESMIDDAVAYIADGVATGTIKPSLDERARARYLVTQSLGTVLLDLTLHPPTDPGDTGSVIRGYVDRHGLPSIELFTGGFLTDRRFLDAYLRYAEPPPGEQAAASAP